MPLQAKQGAGGRSPLVGVTYVLIEGDHLLADGVNRRGVEFPGEGLHAAFDGLHGGGIDFDVISCWGELEGGRLGVAIDVLGLFHVAIEVVVVYEGGDSVGRSGEAAVFLGRLAVCERGGHGLVHLKVGFGRHLVLRYWRLSAEHWVLRDTDLVLCSEHLVLRGERLVLRYNDLECCCSLIAFQSCCREISNTYLLTNEI